MKKDYENSLHTAPRVPFGCHRFAVNLIYTATITSDSSILLDYTLEIPDLPSCL